MVFTTRPSKLLVVPLFEWTSVLFIGGLIISPWIARIFRFGSSDPLTAGSVFGILFGEGFLGFLFWLFLRQALERTRWFWLEGDNWHWRSLRSRGELSLPIKSICQHRSGNTMRDRGGYPISLTRAENQAGGNKLLVQRAWPVCTPGCSQILIEEAWFVWTARRLHAKVSQHLHIPAETWIMSPWETINKEDTGVYDWFHETP